MQPFDLRTADPFDEDTDEDTGEAYYRAHIETSPRSWTFEVVTAEQYRVICQYEAARERQIAAEAAMVARAQPPAPPREPEPEEIPAGGRLTPRQQEFCRRYATQPVATRAAALAGYAEGAAHVQGSRLLKNPLVLERIAAIRAAQDLHYVIEADTVHDKLEALYFDALAAGNHAAAIAALRLQAGLGGLLGTRADGSVSSKPKTPKQKIKRKRRPARKQRSASRARRR